MRFEAFAQGESLLHRVDPRVKVFAAGALASVIAVSHSPWTLTFSLMLGVGLLLLAKLDPREVLQRLSVVNVFVLLLWAILPFSYPGTPLLQVGPLAVSREGLEYTGRITLRTNAIVLITLAMLGTTPVFSLVHALRHMRIPAKLLHVFFFCYRYISVIEGEYLRLRQAMKVRCFRPSTSWHTYRTIAYLVGMLLIRSYERSERIYQAMLCRGFRGEYPVYHHFRMRTQDWVSLVVASFALAGLIAVNLVT